MTPIEVNAILTHAAKFDPRMKRNDPVEQADIAEAWAGVIPDEVTLVAAREAVDRHYSVETRPLMVADLLALAGVVEESPIRDLTGDVLAESKRVALAALGYTVEQYDADQAVRDDVVRRWSQLEVDRG